MPVLLIFCPASVRTHACTLHDELTSITHIYTFSAKCSQFFSLCHIAVNLMMRFPKHTRNLFTRYTGSFVPHGCASLKVNCYLLFQNGSTKVCVVLQHSGLGSCEAPRIFGDYDAENDKWFGYVLSLFSLYLLSLEVKLMAGCETNKSKLSDFFNALLVVVM